MVRQAILSVFGQGDQDFQLLVADDGSNKTTLDCIYGVIGRDPRCLVMTMPHRDDGAARPDCIKRAVDCINGAIPFVRGEIVHYLCDDDYFDKARFTVFNSIFEDPSVVLGYGKLIYVDKSGNPLSARYFERVEDPFAILDMNQMVHRRKAFNVVPQWPFVPGEYNSDGRFFNALAKHWPLHGRDQIVAYKRMHDYNMQSSQGGSTGIRE
jgi:glycosyltransferase involved in cell wall biosynthesis